MSLDRLITEILFGFTGLISIINPISMAFVFLERTQSLLPVERAQLAKKVATNIFFTLLVIFFVGAPVLNFFGISVEALRIGGGFAVAVAGWRMLHQPEAPVSEALPPADLRHLMASAFFPLAVPLTVGPGTVAAAIALQASRPSGWSDYLVTAVISFGVAALVACVIWQIYSRATLLARYLGSEGTKVAMRVSALLLLCVGVQIMLTGICSFLQSIRNA